MNLQTMLDELERQTRILDSSAMLEVQRNIEATATLRAQMVEAMTATKMLEDAAVSSAMLQVQRNIEATATLRAQTVEAMTATKMLEDAAVSSAMLQVQRNIEATATLRAQTVEAMTATTMWARSIAADVAAAESYTKMLEHAAAQCFIPAPPVPDYRVEPRLYIPPVSCFPEPEAEPINKRTIVRPEVKRRIGFIR